MEAKGTNVKESIMRIMNKTYLKLILGQKCDKKSSPCRNIVGGGGGGSEILRKNACYIINVMVSLKLLIHVYPQYS